MTTTITAPITADIGEPEHWAANRYSYDAADQLAGHLRPGGTVRMAMLLHLAQHPEGVSQSGLGLIALGACGARQSPPSEFDMRVICGHMAAEGLLAVELGIGRSITFFSPASRKAARLRRLNGYTLPALIQPARVTA